MSCHVMAKGCLNFNFILVFAYFTSTYAITPHHENLKNEKCNDAINYVLIFTQPDLAGDINDITPQDINFPIKKSIIPCTNRFVQSLPSEMKKHREAGHQCDCEKLLLFSTQGLLKWAEMAQRMNTASLKIEQFDQTKRTVARNSLMSNRNGLIPRDNILPPIWHRKRRRKKKHADYYIPRSESLDLMDDLLNLESEKSSPMNPNELIVKKDEKTSDDIPVFNLYPPTNKKLHFNNINRFFPDFDKYNKPIVDRKISGKGPSSLLNKDPRNLNHVGSDSTSLITNYATGNEDDDDEKVSKSCSVDEDLRNMTNIETTTETVTMNLELEFETTSDTSTGSTNEEGAEVITEISSCDFANSTGGSSGSGSTSGTGGTGDSYYRTESNNATTTTQSSDGLFELETVTEESPTHNANGSEKEGGDNEMQLMQLIASVKSSFYRTFFDPGWGPPNGEPAPSMLYMVKKMLQQLKDLNSNRGFIAIVNGGAISELRDSSSNLMKTIRYLMRPSMKENLVLVVTTKCPGTSKEKHKSGEHMHGHEKLPLFVTGPHSHIFDKAQELPEIPQLVRQSIIQSSCNSSSSSSSHLDGNSLRSAKSFHVHSKVNGEHAFPQIGHTKPKSAANMEYGWSDFDDIPFRDDDDEEGEYLKFKRMKRSADFFIADYNDNKSQTLILSKILISFIIFIIFRFMY